MRQVTFTGYYGMQNYGDDLFGIVSAHGARTWWPNQVPRILAPAIVGQNEDFSIPSIVPARVYSRADLTGAATRAFFSLKEMLTGGRLVFAGGSLFSSNRSPINELLAPLSRISGKSFSAIGVSIGPFNSIADEKSVVSFFRRFDYISVRDQASFEMLKGYCLGAHIENGRDLAGLMPHIVGDSTVSGSEGPATYPRIGYASCHLGENPQAAIRFDDLFVDAISRLPDLVVRLFNLNSHPTLGDMRRSAHVHSRLSAAGVRVEMIDYSRIGVLATWQAIATCSAMVSIRLHGAISAYLSGVPFILYEYHRKCSDFLDDIGQPAILRFKDGPNTVVPGADEFANSLRSLLSGRCLPRLPRHTYSTEAAKHFTHAPWLHKAVSTG